jgi:hypothetical protein
MAMLTGPCAEVATLEKGLGAPIATDPGAVALLDAPTAVERAPEAALLLPTAVAWAAVAVESAPHSVLATAGPALHSGVGSALAGIVQARALASAAAEAATS